MKRVLTLAVMSAFISTTAFAQSSAPKSTTSKRDPVWEGLLIGAGAGVVAAYTFTRINCGPPGYDHECEVIANVVGYPIFVPAGAVIGALIDRAIGNHRVVVAPAVNRRGAALTATVRLGRAR